MNYGRGNKLATFKRNIGRKGREKKVGRQCEAMHEAACSALGLAVKAYPKIVERAARSSGGATNLSEQYFALQQLAQVPFQCSDPKQQKPQA